MQGEGRRPCLAIVGCEIEKGKVGRHSTGTCRYVMRPASTHRHRRVALRAAAYLSMWWSCFLVESCAFCFSTRGLGSLPARALMGAVAACASMLLRERLDHSHTPGDHGSPWRTWSRHGHVPWVMDGAWLLIASVARLLMRDHSSLHARPHTPSLLDHFPRSQHRCPRRWWRRRQVDANPAAPERDGLGLGNGPPSSLKLFQSSRQLPTPPGASNPQPTVRRQPAT